MKVLKKIGVGIISLGLISTFYIPEAKAASRTIVEFQSADGSNFAIKLKSSGKYILKKVGSGNQQCKMYIYNEAMLNGFMKCVSETVGVPYDYEGVYQTLSAYTYY